MLKDGESNLEASPASLHGGEVQGRDAARAVLRRGVCSAHQEQLHHLVLTAEERERERERYD